MLRDLASLTRRRLGRLLRDGVSLALVTAALGDAFQDASARKVHGEHNRRQGGKKTVMCYDGETVRVSTKRRKKWLHKGATRGKCAGCAPICTPGTCGGDGCGGSCACDAGTVCDGESCQPCNVLCTGTPTACGEALNTAILSASAGDALYICPGTYQGIYAPAVSIALYGAGDGDDPTTDTILDGGGVNTVLSLRVPEATVAGMRITNGNGLAGGVEVGSGDATVLNCTMTGNTAIFFGGGLIVTSANLTIRNSTISDNTTNLGGGGLYFAGATGEISDCVISGNTALDGGGGIHADGVTLSISGTAITDNDASTGVTTVGGGLRLAAGTTTLDSACSITGNKAGPGASGGGIFGESGAVAALNGATVTGNTPDQCAGTVSC